MNGYTYQDAAAKAPKTVPQLFPFIALVKNAYSDRMACDLQNWDGSILYNVPVMAKGGIDSSGEIWGEMETPQVGDYVVGSFIGPYLSNPIIIGAFFPYLMDKFQNGQTPENSGSKQFTKKLLEANKLKTFRRIYKSGTTVEVGEDGTVTIETPTGSYIQMKESDGTITLDSSGKISIKNASQNLYTLLNNLKTAFDAFSNSTATSALTATEATGGGYTTGLVTALNALLASLNTAITTFGTGLGSLME